MIEFNSRIKVLKRYNYLYNNFYPLIFGAARFMKKYFKL